MATGIPKIVIRSVRFYKKPVFYQILIIGLLSAIITGSLLTGWSVRASLRKTAAEHLGNTGILITSGSRYFDTALALRLRDSARINCTGLLETTGFCQNLNTQKGVLNAHIFAIAGDFFRFNGHPDIKIKSGEAAINEKIAASLGLKQGDDIIIRYNEISDIPQDAPFAPSGGEGKSVVMKVGVVLDRQEEGNFSLSISQMVPENILINLSDLTTDQGKPVKINRLLVDNKARITPDEAHDILMKFMKISDLGINVIPLKKTGGYELRSDRIFLDNSLLSGIEENIPSAAPVITYLGNRFTHGSASTPYSFVSALPSSLYPDIVTGNDIIIDRWLSEDLSVNNGDTIEMSWYAPDSLNKLIEKSGRFRVRRIVGMEGIWSDSLLMPDFPGISGRESCSDWDAGVAIKLNEIRQKDEAYWNRFRGTPKAFINYDKGIGLWGNNFGPATAIRFPETISRNEISEKLSGHLDPSKNGFRIVNLSDDSLKAASGSVDFSTLFLSLGFFFLLASVVLLSFAVSTYLESKHDQIRTFFALGFKTRWITGLFLSESVLISVAGSSLGSLAGIGVNMLIIKLLNTVWNGAVQTDTLNAYVGLTPVLSGFFTTFVIATVFLWIKIRLHLKTLGRVPKHDHSPPMRILNLVLLLASFIGFLVLFILALKLKDQEILLCFASGSLLLVFLLFALRHYLIRASEQSSIREIFSGNLSRRYYAYYPSHAITPILFIAAGIFAVFITAANRMSFDDSRLNPSGGTGGFILWCDYSIPVREDLTTRAGREAMGLDDEQLSGMRFVQIKRFAGDDASCLNLNQVKVPPLLGADPEEFISRGSFSFAEALKRENISNPWQFLNLPPDGSTIYGIADQTVLQWGLKLKPGDTLSMRSENGQKLNIIVAAGLKSSLFQGYLILGMENFKKYFPSVPGSSISLVEGEASLTDIYAGGLNERLGNFGIRVEKTRDRLASFYTVTNTYLSVFGVFGALGMITGIAGLGFVLLRNYNYRRKEFALMLATGFNVRRIRRLIFSEQMFILLAGIFSGFVPAVIATLPSLKNNAEVPWPWLIAMGILIFLTGIVTLSFSLGSVTSGSLITSLKKE